jgi:hydrogenase maturation protein HypF
MAGDISAAEALCEVSAPERALLIGPEKPIVLLRRKPTAAVAPEVAPESPWLGIMLPCTPMHDLLFRIFTPAVLVFTSGNISDEPILIDESEAQEKLRSVADLFVHHNRPIHTRVDDSVARLIGNHPAMIRRARGYSPSTIPLPSARSELLACGAQQKSTFCLAKDGHAILSQHLGDLENYETLQFFEQTLDRMKRLFQFSAPLSQQVIAHDLHPGYLSTRLAKKIPAARHIAVQHHHAHIAACIAEHRLDGPVIGLAWDGTGYGSDATIWGGEFLVADLATFTRFAHLRSVPLPGGDAAIREPWRVARSYLRDAFDNLLPPGLGCHASLPEKSLSMLDTILERRIYTVETSSCGRLFDAVASIIGLHQVVSFEGQAAMALEAIAGSATEAYDFRIGSAVDDPIDTQQPRQVDMRPMVRQIVDDLQRGQPASAIAARFHNTLVEVARTLCSQIRQHNGLNRVCLSGGCFQNLRLLTGCVRALRHSGFEVFCPRQVPANDGGIALGQAAIACEILQRGL